jgi:membrane-bound lytic murein transglycosylase B
MRRRLTPLALAVLAGCGGASRAPDRAASHAPARAASPPPTAVALPLPAPDGPLPEGAAGLAGQLRVVSARLDAAVDRWDGRSAPPDGVTLLALRQQRLLYRLAARKTLARAVLPRLPGRTRADARDVIAAQRALAVLNRPTGHRRFRTGPAAPAARLLAYYREGTRRSAVSWPLLAAVNYVESSFGRLRNDSTAGAQGPMQFIPSTWASYGRGDVHDPRAAILAAARFLHAGGAPARERAALYRYNPSPLYVRAVEAYASIIRRDRRGFRELYAWQVFVRTPAGLRRLTGPGR